MGVLARYNVYSIDGIGPYKAGGDICGLRGGLLGNGSSLSCAGIHDL